MSAPSKLEIRGSVVDHTARHDGGYLLRVRTEAGVVVARSLKAHSGGVGVTLRGPPPDYSVVE